jgi:hypothetical protein
LLTIILLVLCMLPIYFRSFFYKNLFQKLSCRPGLLLSEQLINSNYLVLTQNQHPAPSTQQVERSWLNTRIESEACQSILLKLTKDEKQLDKNLELVGWYQTVPYLRPKSQIERHIAMRKLSVNRLNIIRKL